MKLTPRSIAQLAAIVLIPVLAVFALTAMTSESADVSENNSQPVNEQTTDSEQPNQSIVSNDDGSIVSYKGEAGKTALELLKEKADIETEDSSFGEFVTSINAVDGGGTQYWLFYVNDEPATVGAGEYETQEGDSIEWRLE